LSTWLHGWRKVKGFPSVSVLSFRFFSNCSEKQPMVLLRILLAFAL
jgi:hypothetical protein